MSLYESLLVSTFRICENSSKLTPNFLLNITVGLPPFKPGEEVKILNNVAQF